MKYEAVIFDLDGTLVHTTPEYRYLIVGDTLKDLGKEPDEKSIDKFWFEARRDEIIQECFDVEPEAFWKIFYAYDTMEVRAKFTKLYDDVGVVQELRQHGCKTGIVTGAPTQIVALELGMLGEQDFDAVVIAHASTEITPKPHPHGLIECLSLLGVDKSKAMYVGNADEDVEAARNAQMLDVLLARGEHEFPEINPSVKIRSLYDLRDLIGS